jgi:molybdenum cofactor biosynthesis enzyme MoaA
METLPTVSSPNFSIIVPGPCNMNCSFCFWERDSEEIGPVLFAQRLSSVIKRLPPQFTKVSITGSEPTLNRDLGGILEEIALSGRFHKVVLTTNGSNLDHWLRDPRIETVTNLNISRHAVSDEVNASVFGRDFHNIISWSSLFELNAMANTRGIPVTCNSVIHENITPLFPFIESAKDFGFSEMCFRKIHTADSDLSMTDYEHQIAHFKIAEHSECPVCRSDKRYLWGMSTWWTASIAEPSDLMTDKVYEAVFHPDGKLYADWSKNIEIDL